MISDQRDEHGLSDVVPVLLTRESLIPRSMTERGYKLLELMNTVPDVVIENGNIQSVDR